MKVAELLGGLIPSLMFLLMTIGKTDSQNGGNLSSSTMVPTPVPTPAAPTPGPQDVPSSTNEMASTTPSDITCCYVQSNCANCSDVYNVNSITYCCPNCRGMVLVTDLVCRCTVPKGYQVPDLKCKLSNEVVGGYIPLKPSYYDNKAGKLELSLIYIFSGFLIFL